MVDSKCSRSCLTSFGHQSRRVGSPPLWLRGVGRRPLDRPEVLGDPPSEPPLPLKWLSTGSTPNCIDRSHARRSETSQTQGA